MSSLTLKELLDTADRLLSAVGIADSRFEAEYLLQGFLGWSRAKFFLYLDSPVEPYQVDSFLTLIRRRCKHEPSQYILGKTEFWSLDFFVSPATLIPRPETEFVLEQTIELAVKQNFTRPFCLDMCTGSGIMAVVLARELAGSSVLAVDISDSALQVAQKNIQHHLPVGVVSLLCADLFSAFMISDTGYFDIIVANPPYVSLRDKENLQIEVREFEPEISLFAGLDGLDYYLRLIPRSILFLKTGGLLALEIGDGQGHKVADIMVSSGYDEVILKRDYGGRERFVAGVKR